MSLIETAYEDGRREGEALRSIDWSLDHAECPYRDPDERSAFEQGLADGFEEDDR